MIVNLSDELSGRVEVIYLLLKREADICWMLKVAVFYKFLFSPPEINIILPFYGISHWGCVWHSVICPQSRESVSQETKLSLKCTRCHVLYSHNVQRVEIFLSVSFASISPLVNTLLWLNLSQMYWLRWTQTRE